MKSLIAHAIDWNSVKLCGVSTLGFITGSHVLAILSGAAVLSTIVYNGIRIYKEFKNKK
jgi:hypothetical protein